MSTSTYDTVRLDRSLKQRILRVQYEHFLKHETKATIADVLGMAMDALEREQARGKGPTIVTTSRRKAK